MPVRRVVRNAPRPRPSALDRPPYPPAQARTIAHASTSHTADPASCDPAQPPDPLPILQPSSAADTASMDGVSGDNAARDSPLVPANWSAYGTRNEDDRDRGTIGMQRTRLRPAKLELLEWSEWDQTKAYDECPPTCLHYSIVWKVNLNNKLICKDTDQDLVLAPQYHWSFILRSKLRRLVQKKLSKHGRITCDDVNVVVKNTGRSERPLVRRFDETVIDWATVERQLVEWGELFRAGKKLIVEMTFNYLAEDHGALAFLGKKASKQGSGSATRRMLAERAVAIDAEQEATGQPPAWKGVYETMRCPGPPCPRGPYCWQDPNGKKHHPLKTRELQALVLHVQRGNALETHDDVPDDIRQQLYAAERQQYARHHKAADKSDSKLPSIVIKNVLPGSHSENVTLSALPPLSRRLVIPGFCDTAVEEYSEWQMTRVKRDDLREGVRRIRDMALKEGLDLVQIHQDQDPDYFIKDDIQAGVAKRFVREILDWVEQYKGNNGSDVLSGPGALED
ncbi:hypothetical protein HBI23_252390 [Parastagonospora nodorum]|nr:hypothetical protein HBI23_252390 [Parastagonospora nodorum]KAH5622313.1 hypothetical protein HBI51_247480 [Parastagonospora nodorum]KAH5983416.1 hypothetical protein HBI84_247050 [Parastagonospora nodorum]KAH6134153.1 hypothetical protein HBI68_251480 [Parastagonospora nodorum]KAH6380497.1 hypothetical protein HBI08_237280 [Parastagonospora nodorum]